MSSYFHLPRDFKITIFQDLGVENTFISDFNYNIARGAVFRKPEGEKLFSSTIIFQVT